MTARASSPAAARARVEAALERLQRIDLHVVVVSAPDEARLAARERARTLAADAGRGELLEEAAGAARDVALGAFARGGFSGTWAATEMSASVANAEDRLAAAAAFEEAAIAAVVEDLADEETLEVLREASAGLGRSTGLPAPGGLSSIGPAAATADTGSPARIVLGGALVLGILGFAAGGLPLALVVFATGAVVAGWLGRRGSASA